MRKKDDYREKNIKQLHETSMLALKKRMVKPIEQAFIDFPDETKLNINRKN